jgi:hypothetical protein
MDKKKVSSISLFSLLIIVNLAVSHTVRTPKEPSSNEPGRLVKGNTPYLTDEGNLPGVTWADDIHPIFIRNECGNCHTRGNEIVVDVLEEFALGIIDPEKLENPYYSYHELVYAEGPPQIQQGETLRDGQCCWPKNYPQDKQRRIWLGHPERSVIVRKLERDYYDWDKPPRFLEEGLALLWGLPMPWNGTEEGHHGAGNEGEIHRLEMRSFLERALLYLFLWVGTGQDQLSALPPRIPTRDKDVLRYWINHTIQVMEEGSRIAVQVLDAGENPTQDAFVHLVGNFNHLTRQRVSDQIDLKTDRYGKTRLSFPKYSLITAFWFVAAEKNGLKTEYQPITVKSGEVSEIDLRLPQ